MDKQGVERIIPRTSSGCFEFAELELALHLNTAVDVGQRSAQNALVILFAKPAALCEGRIGPHRKRPIGLRRN
ncbi:hypothetical protein AC244_01050 [Ensifer adhaerens]|uniref:Uncharacterized protein n=1 Tax=Ensifer adhaerens TaxID=106592 RepID=A0A0L8C5G5_ENSAD|nr:hypothetical protein AC244_01050 [Ensifer adhaerens]